MRLLDASLVVMLPVVMLSICGAAGCGRPTTAAHSAAPKPSPTRATAVQKDSPSDPTPAGSARVAPASASAS